MTNPIPTIVDAQILPGARLLAVQFSDRDGHMKISLAGWIATGGDILAPLRDKTLFESAGIAEFRDAIFWGDEDGDLSIDAVHLRKIADEQEPFTTRDLLEWQAGNGLSNSEAANVVGVSPSTWARYRHGDDIPVAVGIAIRAAKRDPLILQARLKPAAEPGRPRKAFAGRAVIGRDTLG